MPILHSALRRPVSHCHHLNHGQYAGFVLSASSASIGLRRTFHRRLCSRQVFQSNLSSLSSSSSSASSRSPSDGASSLLSIHKQHQQQQQLFTNCKTWPAYFSTITSSPVGDEHHCRETIVFSSDPPTSAASGTFDDVDQYSKYLCMTTFPLKSLDWKTIVDMVTAIQRLTALVNNSNDETQPQLMPKVELAFQLMDRLTLELEAAHQTLDTIALNSNLLISVVHAWKCVSTNQIHSPTFHSHLSNSTTTTTALTPAIVFDKMRQWQARVPSLPRNVIPYQMIITVTTQSADPDLADAILDYVCGSTMTDQSSAAAAAAASSDQASNPQVMGFLQDEALFNGVIYCWAKSRREDAPHRAEALLRRMIDWSDAGLHEVLPSTTTFNNVINTWANAPSTVLYQNTISAPQRAEQLLEEMKQRGLVPDRMSYGGVLTTWARNCHMEGALDRANAILQHMKSLYDEQLQQAKPNQQLVVNTKPTTYCYSAVLSACANHGDVVRAEQLFCELIERYQSTNDRDFFPDATCFTSVMYAWTKSGHRDTPHMAGAILQRMQDFAESTGEMSVRPDVVSFTVVLQAWANSKHPQAPYRCEAILKRMQDLYEKGYANTQPTEVSYCVALDSWVKASSPVDAAERAEALLRHIKTLYESGQNPRAKLCTAHYNSVLQAWARSTLPNAANRAQALYEEMIQQWEAGDVSLKPSFRIVTALVSAWGRSNSLEGANKAQAIFDAALARHDLTDDVEQTPGAHGEIEKGITLTPMHAFSTSITFGRENEEGGAMPGRSSRKPTVFLYTALIDAWAKAGEPERAEQILREMVANGISPSKITYNTVIYGWARSQRSDAAEHAQALIHELELKSKAGQPDLKPGQYAYTTLMSAWGRRRTKEGAEMAQAIFDRLLTRDEAGDIDLQPQAAMYSAVIDAWAKAGEPEKAELILRQMIANQSIGVKPDKFAYTAVIDAWSRAGQPAHAQMLYHEMIRKWEAGASELKPSNRTFTALISAWGRSKTTDGAKKAQAIFDFISARYTATGDEIFKPTAHTYSALINAWSKAGEATKAEAVLRQMTDGSIGVKADFRSYTAAIDAWSRVHNYDAGPRAQALFDEMMKKWVGGDKALKPGVASFATLILAWGRSRSPERAQAIFDDLLARHERGDADLKPDLSVWSALIDAWIKAGDVEKAEAIFRNMGSEGLLTKSYMNLYSALIKAWNRSGRPDAPFRMQALYDDLMYKCRNGDHDLKPDLHIYDPLVLGWIRTESPEGFAKANILSRDMLAQGSAGGEDLKRAAYRYRSIIARKAKALEIRLR